MTDSCGTCYFYRAGPRTCNIEPPQAQSVAPRSDIYQWPKVDPDDWCGAGCDKDTQNSFGPKGKA